MPNDGYPIIVKTMKEREYVQASTDISVVVTTYNQTQEALAFTLNSILRQNCDNFEIVIADDCSTDDPSDFVRQHFDANGFSNYKLVRAEYNIGTVRNMLHGLTVASGRIIKPLSPGDGLYDQSTLTNILSFCDENHVALGFGGIMSYLPDGSIRPYNAPRSIELYQLEDQDASEILLNHVLKTDWIPGCCLFYARDLMIPYLDELANKARVRYCEDLACPLCAADGVRIGSLGKNVIWYEMGTGISTSGGNASVRRMYQDHRNFYEYLQDRLLDKALARRAHRSFSIREFIALRTPFYRMAQKLKLGQYTGDNNLSGSDDTDACEFFGTCMK